MLAAFGPVEEHPHGQIGAELLKTIYLLLVQVFKTWFYRGHALL